ncbi:MAG: hypothetical protein C3F12_13110 [Candidatus Methylomirabilota bacterium]|nr:MAG: hypothetical protein C3F12_13110 [candidate division NC10 bacterium]
MVVRSSRNCILLHLQILLYIYTLVVGLSRVRRRPPCRPFPKPYSFGILTYHRIQEGVRMSEWNEQRIERVYRPGEGREARHGLLSEAFVRLIREELLRGRTVLDVGCGTGRLTFALAEEAGRLIGVDWSDGAIEQATQRARARGLNHVTFVCCDAERTDYSEFGPIDLVVAHLCMSNEILRRAAAVLRPDACIAFSTLHKDQWHETGRSSRFAYGEADVDTALAAAGFDPVYREVECERLTFSAPIDAMAYVEESGLIGKWKAESRWRGFLAYLERGGRALTIRARVTVKARRRSAPA